MMDVFNADERMRNLFIRSFVGKFNNREKEEKNDVLKEYHRAIKKQGWWRTFNYVKLFIVMQNFILTWFTMYFDIGLSPRLLLLFATAAVNVLLTLTYTWQRPARYISTTHSEFSNSLFCCLIALLFSTTRALDFVCGMKVLCARISFREILQRSIFNERSLRWYVDTYCNR